jgi:hypothetical protein
MFQQGPGKGPYSDPRRGFPRTRPFQHIPHILMGVPERPGKISMPWPRIGYYPRGDQFWIIILRIHYPLPVGPVPVPDNKGNGTAQGFSGADTGCYLALVFLDFHTFPAAITHLAALQVAIYILYINRDPGGKILDYGAKASAVAFAGGEKPEHRGKPFNNLQKIKDNCITIQGIKLFSSNLKIKF